jgi:hypothetical protein
MILLRQFLAALIRLPDTINRHAEALLAAAERRSQDSQNPPEFRAEIRLPEAAQAENRAYKRRQFCLQLATVIVTTLAFIAAAVYAGIAAYQLREMKKATLATQKSADAATAAAKTASDNLILAQRPWIKVKHRIVQPLTFNVQRWKGPIASMVVEDTLENVGQSVAMNVLLWEDVIPMDPQLLLTKTARARQSEWCEANRHPQGGFITGNMLFPKDSMVQQSSIGPYMEVVNKAAFANTGGLQGKVGFVLTGCVVYRSSFQSPESPSYQTKFLYLLGEPMPSGGIQPYVRPIGVANKLRLAEFPIGFSAD